MEWNLSFSIPSLFIIIIIMMFYFSLPRLSIRMNRFFVILLLIEGLVVFSDILSSFVDVNYEHFPAWVLWILNDLFFIAFYLRAYFMFAFEASVLRIGPFIRNAKAELMRVPLYIGLFLCISTLFTDRTFYIDSTGFNFGPSFAVTYFVSFFYEIVSLIILFKYRGRLSRRRHLYSLFLYNIVILAGLACRVFFLELLLMDTFCLLAVLIAYLALGNPDFFLEPRGSVFNSYAFREYMDEHNGHLTNGIFGVVVKNYREMRDIYGGKQIDDNLVHISEYLTRNFPEYTVFYYRRGRYLLLGPNDMDYHDISRTIRSRFRDSWGASDSEFYLSPGFIYMDINGKVESSDVLINTLLASFSKAETMENSDCLLVSTKDLKLSENDTNIKRYLERAVENDSVEVFLQPLIDAETDKMVGAEALCRIRDDAGGLVPPGVFIPIAEANGKINELGEQIFIKTCEFLSSNDVEAMGLKWINVNLSPIQFMKADLPERLEEITEKYGVDPSMIHLEITEEAMVDEIFLYKQVKSMQEKGFCFVLDDYGTGYSNIARLKKIEFINIKFDMSIVWEYYKEPDVILPSMVTAFKNMNFGVTAEGIEDESMAEAMKRAGLDLLQGYYYSKPIPMKEFIEKYSVKEA